MTDRYILATLTPGGILAGNQAKDTADRLGIWDTTALRFATYAHGPTTDLNDISAIMTDARLLNSGGAQTHTIAWDSGIGSTEDFLAAIEADTTTLPIQPWSGDTILPTDPSPYVVHVEGPDDILPFTNWHEALAEAKAINDALLRMVDSEQNPDSLAATGRIRFWAHPQRRDQFEQQQRLAALAAQIDDSTPDGIREFDRVGAARRIIGLLDSNTVLTRDDAASLLVDAGIHPAVAREARDAQ